MPVYLTIRVGADAYTATPFLATADPVVTTAALEAIEKELRKHTGARKKGKESRLEETPCTK